MNRNLLYKILIGIASFALLIVFFMAVLLEPLLGNKIQAAMNKKNENYIFKIEKVQVSLMTSSIEFDTIRIYSKKNSAGRPDLVGKIKSLKFNGINIAKALFKKDIYIREVAVSDVWIIGKIPFPEKTKPPIIVSFNIRIGRIQFDKTNLEIRYDSTARSFSVKEGAFSIYNLQLAINDTISPRILKKIEFRAMELISVSSDSMYSYKAKRIIYAATSNKLAINKIEIHPNYTEYEFTSRSKYETDRIEIMLNKIFIHGFSVAGYLKSGDLVSSYIEIGEMDVQAFRDKRKLFRHIKKPAFQDMIYNYPGDIHIDSMHIKSGRVVYSEHVKSAYEPGNIYFNEIKAEMYRISNRKIYKSENAFLILKANTLLMGKGKMTVLLKAKIFDSSNTFSLKGTLAAMEVSKLNPLLEKNAFLYATSGRIEAMDFSFMANNVKASGNLTMRYHALNIAMKNKISDDTTALKEKVISMIANIKLADSNPLPGEEVRTGTIDYDRDPERFIINYCFKSILSGIKSSIVKKQTKKTNHN